MLAADVRLSEVRALGWPGVAVVAVLMLLVRPASVFASTYGSTLSRNEKRCLAWIAPRGIVAAAVASLFAAELDHAQIAGGEQLRALVFVVIAATVTLQGLTAGIVADRLGVRLPPRSGVLVLGANALARFVARVLARLGEPVVVVESRAELCEAARTEGLEVVQGDGLAAAVLLGAKIDGARWCLGMTPNEHVNFLFARLIADELRGPKLAVLLERHDHGVSVPMADAHDVGVLFYGEINVLGWLDAIRRGLVEVQQWRFVGTAGAAALAELPLDDVLPIAMVRSGQVDFVTPKTAVREGDELAAGVVTERRASADAWFLARGWRRSDGPVGT